MEVKKKIRERQTKTHMERETQRERERGGKTCAHELQDREEVRM